MITDVQVEGVSWLPVSGCLGNPLAVEDVSIVPDKEGGKKQVVYHVRTPEGELALVYTYASCAVRAGHLVKTLCPCSVTFNKREGYYTLLIVPNPLA